MQQDAHEFLNFLINRISEIILGTYINAFDKLRAVCDYGICVLAERQQTTTTNNIKSKGSGENGTAHSPQEPTWVQEIFQVFISESYIG